jgi:hypothetical protein
MININIAGLRKQKHKLHYYCVKLGPYNINSHYNFILQTAYITVQKYQLLIANILKA